MLTDNRCASVWRIGEVAAWRVRKTGRGGVVRRWKEALLSLRVAVGIRRVESCTG